MESAAKLNLSECAGDIKLHIRSDILMVVALDVFAVQTSLKLDRLAPSTIQQKWFRGARIKPKA